MRGRYAALALLALGAGVGAGIGIERGRSALAVDTAESGPDILYWAAPMDPNFRNDGPGKSPMGMDLIPVYEGQAPAGDPAEVTLSSAEVNAIGVRSATARIEDVAQRVETVGFVAYDEHATSHIHTRVEGWIERLAVRAVGDPVAEGDLLFELYAPEITIASSELVRATRRQNSQEIAIARTKLRNFGVSPRQIDEMAQADRAAPRIRYYAPRDGVVIALEGADGMFLRPETRALSLTDTSTVWLIVDVFERDIGRITPGMTAKARMEHLPGEVFEGEIDYIFPELDPETRTLKLRLRFDTAAGRLRPNMFASVALFPSEARQALTVPSEAVIRTGRAERVILRGADGTFRPRLVTTGLRGGFGAGGRTEIVQGLKPGEEVVASAQFLIDSESALNAGMIRLAPTEAAPVAGRGVLVAFDPETRRARINHDAIEALDWPAMETVFTVRSDVGLDALSAGDKVAFEAVRGADGLLSLSALGRDDGIAATGRGIVHAVTEDGRLTMTHDSIPALGWPEMRMDFDVTGVDPASVPLDTPVTFDLAEDEDGMFAIVALRPEDGIETDIETPRDEAAPPITVEGRIEAVDAQARNATIEHGPITGIGMPGMTMEFALAEDVNPVTLPVGEAAVLTFHRPDGMTMVLASAELRPEPIIVTGTINSISEDFANITHGPIAAISMPGMTMDFELDDGLDPAALPIGRETVIMMEQGDDFSLTVIGTEEMGQ